MRKREGGKKRKTERRERERNIEEEEREGEERKREREGGGGRREREREEILHPQNYISTHIHPFLKPPHKHTQLQARMLINRPSKSKHSLTQTSQEFHKR